MKLNCNIKNWIAMLGLLLSMLLGYTVQAQVFIEGNVYGGGNAADVVAGSTEVTVEKGAMGSVYGGGNQGSIPGGNTTVTLLGGHVGYNLVGTAFNERTHQKGIEKKWNGVYGGGYGESTMVSGVATVNVGKGSGMKENVEVYGSVYGGGEMGQVGTNTQSHQVTVKSDGTRNVHVAGAVFGGGRGYAVTSEGETIIPTGANAGAMKGHANVAVGTVGQDASKIHIDGMNYYSPLSDVKDCYYYVAINDSEKPIKWEHTIYEYDNTNKKFKVANQSSYDPKKTYYERMGAVAVVGGGEQGAVQGGNATVTISSGTMGSLIDGLIEGEVYGGGLNASVDGRTLVTVNGSGAWIRDAVYGGGCKGEVLNQNNAEFITQVNFAQGWARNVFGGSNMVDMKAGSKSKVVVGEGMNNDDNTLVSQSVYGGNGYSKHNGTTEVIIHRGRVGFVKAQYDINTQGDAITKNHYVEGTGAASQGSIVPYHSTTLVYDGSVYGGGFGPNASVTQTKVEMRGGIVKTGVFGGGELGTVAYDGATKDITYKNQQIESDGTLTETIVKHTKKAGNLTTVLVSGGEASMVFGGGRGFSNALGDTKTPEPGAVFGNTLVEISGTAKISHANMYRTYAAGNVYGGGMEGIVYGNTSVTVAGGNVICNVYGGGRGFGTSYDKLIAESQNISHRASVDAGALYGNTSVLVNAGQVGSSVYGGGEGWYAHTALSGVERNDTTGTIRGNVKVEITGSTKIGNGNTKAWEQLGDWDARGVFGGGRMASVWGYSDVWIHGSANVANVYGGNDISGRVIGKNRPNSTSLGNLNITKDTTAAYVKVDGTPKVGRVFGGGNGNYDYTANSSYAKLHATKPVQPSTYVDIKMGETGSIITTFGGGNAANVDTSRVYIYGAGVIDTVFGGGNAATVTTRASVEMKMPLTTTDKIKYLFGGNNQATMNIIPNIYLTTGRVMNVYGGGNAGQMTASEVRKDIFNQDVENLSTYVFVNSSQVVVSGDLYGGCNHAKVHHGTFVDVRQTAPAGIANLYGGNDISDTVASSRIDMNGGVVHNIFGGGNGVYDYVSSGGAYDVKENGVVLAKKTPGRPYTSVTNVNIYGGTMTSNIYGGGNAGDCGNTNVVINDTYKGSTSDATIEGKIFGGGRGLLSKLCTSEPHVGNVTNLAKTDLYNVKTLRNAIAYGGGNAGDVKNTLLTVHPNWNQKLDALYGGCYGSDVLGTARTIMNCIAVTGAEQYNVYKLYGGNDFSGTVKNSVLTVNNGKYYLVYGAGNGRYNYSDNSINPNHCSLPNSEGPTINFNDGIVMNNMYGGGDLGYVFKGDTTRTYANISDYAHIVVNVHGGDFKGNIFTGGAGSDGGNQLVYGLKQLNMDGGTVKLSVYGGTENVRDGYPAECTSTNTTTRRPSTIMNIVGGRISNHVYGGGYLGKIYGSVFVNIGKHAVENSPVWTNSYNGATYSTYKPQFVENSTSDTSTNLMARDCNLMASIYNGANWGDAGKSYLFDEPGFIGGESHIYIDGLDYNTTLSEQGTHMPFMHIEKSVIGSGTSCEGGDIVRDIKIRNYGTFENCRTSKKIYSVQRADNLLLENTAIEMLGDYDSYSAYPSQSYTVNRVKHITMKGYNLVTLDNTMTKIESLRFEQKGSTELVAKTTLPMYANMCSDATTMCDKMMKVDNTSNPYTMLFIKNGVSLNIIKEDGQYGRVEGFAYFVAEDATKATIIARHKVATGTGDVNIADGGFRSVCTTDNTFTSDIHNTAEEYPYINFGNKYRVWAIGDGRRFRQVTILAHSRVELLPDVNKNIQVNKPNSSEKINLSVAKATLQLPPALVGTYYTIESGVTVDEANGNELKLLNTAWNPTSWDNPNVGNWLNVESSSSETLTNVDPQAIFNDPTHTFGLMMKSGNAFSGNCHSSTECNKRTTISGNGFFMQNDGYESDVIEGGDEIIPELEFYLTYSKDFVYTILRDIKFTLIEHDAAGNVLGLVDVVVTISTIIDEFIDSEVEVLAMYNEGVSDQFVRKFVLPSSLERRELYLSNVHWRPFIQDEGGVGSEEYFKMWDASNVTNKSGMDASTFAVEVCPSEDLSNTISSSLGWYSIENDTVDVYGEASRWNGTSYNNAKKSYSMKNSTRDSVLLTTQNNYRGKGTYLGILDGRSSAAINIVLNFNGERVYPKDGYVGKIILGFDYYSSKKDAAEGTGQKLQHFNLCIKVKTRVHGDTIYMASASTITRGGKTLTAPEFNMSDVLIGKTPRTYVRTFEQAMKVYTEGDVLAIMDVMNFTGNSNQVLRGSDYCIIPVIRYSGSHTQFPGKECAYRGPMISLSNTSKFTVYNMRFDGGAVCKRYNSPTAVYVPDTLAAYAPVISVKDEAIFTLADKSSVVNNYNKYSGTDKKKYGAINLTKTGTKRPKLVLINNVEMKNNFCSSAATSQSGAIYDNDGIVHLGASHASTEIRILDNYKIPDNLTYWKSYSAETHGITINRNMIDETKLINQSKVNVYLTRTPLASQPNNDMKDDVSDVITFNSKPASKTRIGITKPFPGPHERDTIMIARVDEANPSIPADAYGDGIFVSDNKDYNIFYSSTINPLVIYFQRCASFQKQYVVRNNEAYPGHPMKEVITYHPNLGESCSSGIDSLLYNIRGGFYPYTYTWELANNSSFSDAEVVRTKTTPYTDDEIRKEIKNHIYTKAALSSSDTILTVKSPFGVNENSKTYYYRVTATDLMGCKLVKSVELKLNKTEQSSVNGVNVPGYKPTNLNDTLDEHLAKIDRYFKGIKLETQVVANDSWGSITRQVIDNNQQAVNITPTTLLCPNDRVKLNATPKNNKKFIMWDFDPYDEPQTELVVPTQSPFIVTAYFGPKDYWTDAVHTKPSTYTTQYNGDVDIHNENDLAWLISVVNGMNGEQARPFFFNKVTIHSKGSPYDMSAHLWTPVGSFENKFRGRLIVEDGVVIKNIYLNEPQMEYVGFFGHLDSATVTKLNLQSVMAHGSQYVGGLAAEAIHTELLGCSVTDNETKSILTLLTTNHTSGGMVGKAEYLKIAASGKTGSVAKAKYLGSAVYSGGVVGYGDHVSITSTHARTDDRMSALYMGGIIGYSTATGAPTNAKMSSDEESYIANNYVHYTTLGNNERVGGLVGFAKNTILENNYVYGETDAKLMTGALGGMVTSNVGIHNCFYQEATDSQPFGANGSSIEPTNIATFNGNGNQVEISESVGGINNLTRVLNNWVREKNADSTIFLTWRSDLDTVNNGYPVFGKPDIIPVHDTLTQDACDEYEWNGVTYTESGCYSMSYIDSALCIDSTVTLNLVIHDSYLINIEDSVLVGDSYTENGFYVSETETELLRETVENEGVAVLQLTNNLISAYGCDSVMVLNLTVYSDDNPTDIQEPLVLDIKVYPNPTTSSVMVESEGLISVEIFDDISRRVAFEEVNTGKCRINLDKCAAGSYYLRIRTSQGVAIRKVIKK